MEKVETKEVDVAKNEADEYYKRINRRIEDRGLTYANHYSHQEGTRRTKTLTDCGNMCN